MDIEANLVLWGTALFMIIMITFYAGNVAESKVFVADSVRSVQMTQFFNQQLDLFALNAKTFLYLTFMQSALELGNAGGVPLASLSDTNSYSGTSYWYTTEGVFTPSYIHLPLDSSGVAKGMNSYPTGRLYVLVIVNSSVSTPVRINGVAYTLQNHAGIFDIGAITSEMQMTVSSQTSSISIVSAFASNKRDVLESLLSHFSAAMTSYTENYSPSKDVLLRSESWHYVPSLHQSGSTHLFAFSPQGISVDGIDSFGRGNAKTRIWRSGIVETTANNPYFATYQEAVDYAASTSYSATNQSMKNHIEDRLYKKITYTRNECHIHSGQCAGLLPNCNAIIESHYSGSIFPLQSTTSDGYSIRRQLEAIINPSNDGRLWDYQRSSITENIEGSSGSSGVCHYRDDYNSMNSTECADAGYDYIGGRCRKSRDVVDRYDTCSVTCTYTYDPEVILKTSVGKGVDLYDGSAWRDFFVKYAERYRIFAFPSDETSDVSTEPLQITET